MARVESAAKLSGWMSISSTGGGRGWTEVLAGQRAKSTEEWVRNIDRNPSWSIVLQTERLIVTMPKDASLVTQGWFHIFVHPDLLVQEVL